MVAVFAPKGTDGEAIINTPDAANAWFTTMAIYAIVGMLLLFFCFTQTKERVVMDAKDMDDVKVSDLWTEFMRHPCLAAWLSDVHHLTLRADR